MLLFNGHSFPQAMIECDRADREYVQLCYQSIGRDISSDTYRDPAQALRLCLQGQAAYRGHCLLGAAKNMIDVTWRTDQALDCVERRRPTTNRSATTQSVSNWLTSILSRSGGLKSVSGSNTSTIPPAPQERGCHGPADQRP